MAETKTHPAYGEITVLQSGSALVQIEVADGDSFWVTAASFIDKKKKATKRRAKKKKVVHKLDDSLIDALLVRETRAEEPEPEVFDEVEVVQEGESKELENEEAEIAEDAA
jgi:hypothetical protein